MASCRVIPGVWAVSPRTSRHRTWISGRCQASVTFAPLVARPALSMSLLIGIEGYAGPSRPGVAPSARGTSSNQPHRGSPAGRSKRVTYGLRSSTGVPSSRSTPAKVMTVPEMPSSRTRLSPIGLGRRGARVAKTPVGSAARAGRRHPSGAAGGGAGTAPGAAAAARPGRPSAAEQPRVVETGQPGQPLLEAGVDLDRSPLRAVQPGLDRRALQFGVAGTGDPDRGQAGRQVHADMLPRAHRAPLRPAGAGRAGAGPDHPARRRHLLFHPWGRAALAARGR